MLKLLIAAFILSGPDWDGWVALERPESAGSNYGADERDPSVWVVFTKQMGCEKFLIQFPDQPTYQYLGARGLEVVSQADGAEHRLQVLEEIFIPRTLTKFEKCQGGALQFEPGEAGDEAAKLKKFSDAGGSQIQWLPDAGRFKLCERSRYTSSNELLALRKQQLEGVYIIAESEQELFSDLVYRKDGFWFQERWIAAGHHTYFLQTKTSALQLEAHQIFIHSFDLEVAENV